MSRIDSDIPSRPDGPRTRPPSGLFIVFLLFILVSANLINEWYTPTSASAATVKNPNSIIASPSWLQTSTASTKIPDLNVLVKGKQDPTIQPIGHPQTKLPAPQMLSLTPLAQHFLSSDKHFAVDIAAGTVSATQVQAAGGKIQVQIVQTDGPGGGSASGQLLFGTYQLNLLDAQGQPLTTLALAQPISVSYHLSSDQASLLPQNPLVYAFWGAASPHNTAQQKTAVRQPTTVDARQPHAFKVNIANNGLTWTWNSLLTPGTATTTASTHPALVTAAPAVSSSTVTFSTQTPEASWGTPSDFQVGMNSGSISYSYPFSIPTGGLVPPLSMSYSSKSVNGSYNPQATSPWLGEG